MFARRQFIQSLLSGVAVLALPAASRTLPSSHLKFIALGPNHEGSQTGIEEGVAVERKIKVVGVGGGGSNALHHMIACGLPRVEYIFANTDTKSLNRCGDHKTIRLHRDKLRARSKQGRSGQTAELAEHHIRSALEGADMVFIAASMGGGTGTQAAPVIARIAKEMGILTVAVITMPFSWEGKHRMSYAEVGAAKLKANVGSLIVVPNDKLEDILGDCLSCDEAFTYVNDLIRAAVGGIVEIVNTPSALAADFMDVRTIMTEPGKAVIGMSTASGPDRVHLAAQQAMTCPMLEGVALSDAKGVLVVITAAKNVLTLSDAILASNTIRANTSPGAHFIYGTTLDQSLKDEIRVTVVATGL